MQSREYAAFDGLGLAELIASGQTTAAEALAAAQERAAEVNPKINAIVVPMDTEAAERVREPLSGPFAGVPFLIKDLGQEYAGRPSSGGSRSLAALNATRHSTVVQRWLDAGLVIFGKTNTPEFGAKGVTEPDLFGAARNPFALDRTPGGSSGGSAAAVAAGIVPVAGASDGGGSIRIPAACCGLFGLKPGRGLVPYGPTYGEPLQGTATNGVVSRSVRDTAAMLDVLAGPDETSPYRSAVPGTRFLDEVGREPGRLRIGFHTATAVNPDPHPSAVRAVEEAAALLAQLGHEVEPVDSPVDDAALARDFLTSWFVYVAWQVDAARKRGAADADFELDTLLMAALGRSTSGVELCDSIERRHAYVQQLAGFHQRYDLLLTPTIARPPVEIGSMGMTPAERAGARLLLGTRTTGLLPHLGVVDRMVQQNLGWVPYTQLANITGRPAASVPLYWTDEGLPLGVQFVAQPGGEALLLRLAAQLETAQPWAGRLPGLVEAA
jgi:Asp-tRNA(Asn)/Glu-tRNA(Gln) amidotransferase A subunit family amidase